MDSLGCVRLCCEFWLRVADSYSEQMEWLDHICLQQGSLPSRLVVLNVFQSLMAANFILVAAYGVLFGTHPKNAFLSALFASLGLGTVAMALKFQLADRSEGRSQQFLEIPEHRAVVECTWACVLVLLASYTFLG
eukprot:Gregarina_sp_Poly_1__9343@NODE_580_length_7449_cov_96_149688_g63_i1_p5_GENE_NODE_580_length_7449_cov_96_149688_g63_i1NODE_580_length_7449_cov_96_149688_g63_i1_p5_ORF_typecomplete_len135_score10_56DAD/PF02109_16/7_9e10DUF3681/PF12442_8/0_0011DUF981/PF06168_11/0_0061Trp_oprn_chp/PF09534_10/0_059_NODE_580_length_7449_cov_96_149688_g63_i114721876